MKELFGILAGLVGLAAAVPYIKSIVKGKTQPHRVAWAIWATLGLITLSSYAAKGARWSLLLVAASVINNFVIFLFSLKFGTGGTSARDRIALALGFTGIALWAITRQATYALLFAIAADAIGTALTLEKAYKSPFSESALSWSIAATASVCGLLAVQSYNFAQTVYPAYAVAGGSLLALTTIGRRFAKSIQ